MYYTLAVQVAGEAVGRRLLGNWWTWSASINYLAWIKKKKSLLYARFKEWEWKQDKLVGNINISLKCVAKLPNKRHFYD